MTKADVQAQVRVRELDWELQKQKLPLMTAENVELKYRVEQLEKELEVVQWDLSVLEDGVDTREVVKEYCDLKK